ncbi:hypothetical protein T11_14401 [Trichinella zimbabwensis]|uniref:Uncharacterized protein n=1 Tax=Trichinella zimbabwensis TaxID=268475 RepID=A0A0V1HZV0_9BILA|nr:hypothetical protein T11_14401 [Trichinella zimbabwensis]
MNETQQLVELVATYYSATKSKREPAAQYMRYLGMDVIPIFSSMPVIVSMSVAVTEKLQYPH